MFGDYFFWTASISMVVCLVVRQLVRERLVIALLAHRSELSSEVSCWAPSTSGFVMALKWHYVWGTGAKELMALPYAKRYVALFRVVDVLLLALVIIAVGALIFELGWMSAA